MRNSDDVASLNIQLFLLYYSIYTLYLKETNDSFHRLTLAFDAELKKFKNLVKFYCVFTLIKLSKIIG
jgi:hypothetical protein